MAETDTAMKTFLLLDSFNKDGRRLYESFRSEGFEGPVLCINDEGFLPEDVISVYGYFCGSYKDKPGIPGKPRYFNQIEVPDYWEISGTNMMGQIHDRKHLRGRIYYTEPAYKRLVKIVDWLDESGTCRLCEHYNSYGALYAKTILDSNGKRFCKLYMDADGREVLAENFVTNDIILNRDGKSYIFRSKTELAIRVIEELGLAGEKMIFNSLSYPFFVSQRLPANGRKDILIWQEGVRADVPGNMQVILSGQSVRASEVYVQNKKACEALIANGALRELVHPLGYVYSFVRQNTHRKDALICTNSDNIEKLEEIVSSLPEMHFHVVAVTEMSQKLLSMGSYSNVSLYPGVSTAMAEELFGRCDYYLDINHEGEILNSVERAFVCNHLILGFASTLHNKMYVANEHVCADAGDMTAKIKAFMADEKKLDEALELQHQAAMSEGRGVYKKLW